MGKSGCRFLLPAAAAITTAVAGCSTSECLDNQSSRPVAVFLASGGENTGSKIRVDSLTIRGVDAPGGVALAEDENLSGINLPFRIGAEETTYVFEYGGPLKGLRDELTFRYSPRPEFVSEACGAVYVFENLEVSSTNVLIDSVVCPWKTVDNVEREYIKIYFRTADDEEQQ